MADFPARAHVHEEGPREGFHIEPVSTHTPCVNLQGEPR
jgi:hypothetical protein